MGHFWLVALLFGFCNILSIPVRYVFPFPGLTTLDEIEVKVQLSAHDWEPWVRVAPLSRLIAIQSKSCDGSSKQTSWVSAF